MEINFESLSTTAYRESFHQIKRVQASMESVVPDTQDDIGRLLSVQPALFLKEKSQTERGVYICGEASASILYINELENAVSALHLSQSFTLEYELADPSQELFPQIRLSVSHSEAHILNPRKLSVTVEITGELNGYQRGSVQTETIPPVETDVVIHTKCDQARVALINAVCEKTFVLNEQFPFPAGKPQPKELLTQNLSFEITSRQLIGSKVLVKGRVCLTVCYASEELSCPLTEEFSSAFSQLIDIGQEYMDVCSIDMEPTSAWVSLIDTMNGEKALDAEIHALIQIVSRCEQDIRYVSDAYSNLMSSELEREELSYSIVTEPRRLGLNADEVLELPEDCSDVLLVLPSLTGGSLTQDRAAASLVLDVLYRTQSGTLSCIRRLLNLETDCSTEGERLLSMRLADSYFRPEQRQLSVRAGVEFTIENHGENAFSSVIGVTLDESSPYNFAAFPTITAVRAEEEGLWELARKYHSSPERILAMNEVDGEPRGKLLLIPKSI